MLSELFDKIMSKLPFRLWDSKCYDRQNEFNDIVKKQINFVLYEIDHKEDREEYVKRLPDMLVFINYFLWQYTRDYRVFDNFKK